VLFGGLIEWRLLGGRAASRAGKGSRGDGRGCFASVLRR
jgi:hypothetical protein